MIQDGEGDEATFQCVPCEGPNDIVEWTVGEATSECKSCDGDNQYPKSNKKECDICDPSKKVIVIDETGLKTCESCPDGKIVEDGECKDLTCEPGQEPIGNKCKKCDSGLFSGTFETR